MSLILPLFPFSQGRKARDQGRMNAGECYCLPRHPCVPDKRRVLASDEKWNMKNDCM